MLKWQSRHEETDMTYSIPSPRTLRLDLTGGLSATLQRAVVALHPAEARALRRAGLFHRLVQFWVRPLGSADTATDAATRLDILSRGGFPR
jgi:hypothetical protein